MASCVKVAKFVASWNVFTTQPRSNCLPFLESLNDMCGGDMRNAGSVIDTIYEGVKLIPDQSNIPVGFFYAANGIKQADWALGHVNLLLNGIIRRSEADGVDYSAASLQLSIDEQHVGYYKYTCMTALYYSR